MGTEVTIDQLPAAATLTGTEPVESVQAGASVETTVAAIEEFPGEASLPGAGTLAGTEPMRVIQSGVAKQSTSQAVANLAITNTGREVDPVIANGAAGNLLTGTNGSVAAAGTTFSQTDGYTFTSADVGKTIVINGAAANGGTLKTTIAALLSSTSVQLTAAATVAASTSTSCVGSAAPSAAGTAYAPGDVLTLTGGASTSTATVTVATTKVVSATIVSGHAGSGGLAGTYLVYGTTGTGTKFAANVTVSGGAITAVNSITLGGAYTANPTTVATEPVTAQPSYPGLTGAELDVVMGVSTVNVTVPGCYTVQPSNPISTTGGSGNSDCTLTGSWTTNGAWLYATDDTAAITAAGAPLFLETGKKFFSTLSDTSSTFMPAKTKGYGQIYDANYFGQAPMFTQRNTAPSVGSWNGPEAYWSGDLSAVQLPIAHFITGTATLGEPSSGYSYTNECYPVVGALYNSSGWNNSTSSNAGRTAACFARVHVYNVGQGDAVAYNATCFVSGAKAGATNVLANPAATICNGDLTAGSDGVYLNPFEVVCNDSNYDVASVGYVSRANRNKDIGALGAFWYGFIAQSSDGTLPIDVGYHFAGPSKIGIDLTNLTLNTSGTWTDSAIVLTNTQRIYFSGTAPSSAPYFCQSTGSTYISGNGSNNDIGVVCNNTTAALFTNSGSFLYATTVIGANQNNRLQVVGGANGTSPTLSVTGTSDSSVGLIIATKGSGLIQFSTAGNFTANGSTAASFGSTSPGQATPQEWLTIKDSSGTTRYIPCF